MKITSLHDFYISELEDLYDAENRIIKALPKMADAATSTELRDAFEQHLQQTRLMPTGARQTRISRVWQKA
jgi:ferritin-like metal-binding protein YciE